MYKIGEKIPIHITRYESNFDRACDSALASALSKFGADSDGCLRKVDGFDRSTDTMKVVFVEVEGEVNITGKYYTYRFSASVERNDDDNQY